MYDASTRIEQLEQRQLLAADLSITDPTAPPDDVFMGFANTKVHAQSVSKSFSVRNQGDAALVFSNIDANGHANDFDIVFKDNNFDEVEDWNWTIPAGQTYYITGRFEPTRTGYREVELAFNTNDPDNAEASLWMGGTALSPGPDSPSNGDATATGSGTVNMTWTDNSGDEDGFRIYATTNYDDEQWDVVKTVSFDQTSATITGLTNYTRYYFAVASYNQYSDSPEYAEDSARTLAYREPTSNNSPSKARNLGTLTGPINQNEFVSTTDTIDYFKVRMSATGSLRAEFADVAGALKAQVRRINANGSTTVVAEQTSSSPFTLNPTGLASAYYYIRVSNVGTSRTGYMMKLEPDYAGNDQVTARNTGTLTAGKYYFDTLGVNDSADYYKFTLGSAKTVTLDLTGFKTDLDMELLSSTGTQLALSEDEALTPEQITRSLEAGTYYVKIYPHEPEISTRYKMAFAVA